MKKLLTIIISAIKLGKTNNNWIEKESIFGQKYLLPKDFRLRLKNNLKINTK